MTVVRTPGLEDTKSSWSYSPLVHLLRTYTKYIQDLFSSENPLKLNFSTDPEQTDIIIKAANSINAEVIDKNPVVLIHRSGFSWPPQALHGDMQELNIKTQQVTREAMLTGGVFFTVITSNDLFADDIAWYIMENIWLLKNVAGGNLFEGSQNFSLSPPSTPQGLVIGDYPQAVAVQISFVTRLLRKSSVEPLNLKRLKGLDLVLKEKATDDTLLEVEISNQGT